MALGVKVKNIQTKESYSIQELLERIKDEKFSAGQPSLVKHGFTWIITFPALDRQNQVWVTATGFGDKTQKFSISKNEQAGIDNMVTNAVIDKLTDGLFSFGRMAGNNAKLCEQQVVDTANELNALNL